MDAKKQDMELEHNNVVVLMIDIMFSSIATGTGYLHVCFPASVK